MVTDVEDAADGTRRLPNTEESVEPREWAVFNRYWLLFGPHLVHPQMVGRKFKSWGKVESLLNRFISGQYALVYQLINSSMLGS